MRAFLTLLLTVFFGVAHAQQPGKAGSPELRITFAGKTSGVLTRNEISETNHLVILNHEGVPDTSVSLFSFKLTVVAKGSSPLEEVMGNSSEVTKRMKKKILSQPVDAAFYFERIEIKNKDGSIRKMPPLSFKLGE